MALGPAGRSALPPRPATQAAAKPPVELSEADFCEDAAEVGEVWFGSQLALARSAAGVAVGWVTPDSPAALAGLEPGDFIFQVDGANVDDATDIWSEVVRAGAGASLRLGVHRAGQMRLLRVALTTRPALEASSSGATERGPENARTAWTP
jgi:membrane-associated protease RseP (regulator of RpoE activity)